MIIAALTLLAATLQTSPEIPLTPAVRNATPYFENLGSIAAGDDAALVTWWDARGIRAARIDRDGRTLDAQPIAISDIGMVADVTWTGERWLAVWAAPGITARFIDDDGDLSEAITVAPPEDVDAINVACTDEHCLVAWKSGFTLRALRLDANARPLGAPFTVHGGPFLGPEVVAVDDKIAIVWAAGGDIHALHVDSGGNQTRTLTDTDVHSGPLYAIADGDELVISWALPRESAVDVMIAREGETPHAMHRGDTGPSDLIRIGGTVYAVLVTAAGMELVSEEGTTAVRERQPGSVRASSFGDRAIFVFSVGPSEQSYSYDLHTLVADATLTGAERLLAIDAPLQKQPAIARGADGESLAVWVEVTGGSDPHALMTLRLDAAGRPMAAPVKLASLR